MRNRSKQVTRWFPSSYGRPPGSYSDQVTAGFLPWPCFLHTMGMHINETSLDSACCVLQDWFYIKLLLCLKARCSQPWTSWVHLLPTFRIFFSTRPKSPNVTMFFILGVLYFINENPLREESYICLNNIISLQNNTVVNSNSSHGVYPPYHHKVGWLACEYYLIKICNFITDTCC